MLWTALITVRGKKLFATREFTDFEGVLYFCNHPKGFEHQPILEDLQKENFKEDYMGNRCGVGDTEKQAIENLRRLQACLSYGKMTGLGCGPI